MHKYVVRIIIYAILHQLDAEIFYADFYYLLHFQPSDSVIIAIMNTVQQDIISKKRSAIE